MQINNNKIVREAREYIAAHEQLKRYQEGHLIQKLCDEVERLENDDRNKQLEKELDEIRWAGL